MLLPKVVPVFPLPDHVLLIGLPTPYRVFEPRYRALVDDLLGREPADRWLAVPRLSPGWRNDYEGSPAYNAIAALGLVRNIRPLDDGQFMIVVEGICRCRLVESNSTSPYRMACPIEYADAPSAISDSNRDGAIADILQLVDRVRQRLGPHGSIVKPLVENQSDPGALIDRLGAALISDTEVRQSFLESQQLAERIQLLQRSLMTLLDLADRGPQNWQPSIN